MPPGVPLRDSHNTCGARIGVFWSLGKLNGAKGDWP